LKIFLSCLCANLFFHRLKTNTTLQSLSLLFLNFYQPMKTCCRKMQYSHLYYEHFHEISYCSVWIFWGVILIHFVFYTFFCYFEFILPNLFSFPSKSIFTFVSSFDFYFLCPWSFFFYVFLHFLLVHFFLVLSFFIISLFHLFFLLLVLFFSIFPCTFFFFILDAFFFVEYK